MATRIRKVFDHLVHSLGRHQWPPVSGEFNDRSESTVDFQPWLDGPVFEPLKKAS